MGKSLRAKLAIGALGLVIIVCVAIIAVVSFLVNRQNLQAVERDLATAVMVTEMELVEKQQELAADISRLVSENALGPKVKFLMEYSSSDGSDLSITKTTYTTTAAIAVNSAMAIESKQIGIYDLQGNLRVFAFREADDAYRFGYYSAPTAYLNSVRGKQAIDESAWQRTEQTGLVKLDLSHGGQGPGEERIYFGNRDGKLCVEVLVPIFTNELREDGDPVLQRTGFVHAVKELDQHFVDRLAMFTGMSVNIYAGTRLSLGGLTEYGEVDGALLAAQAARKGGELNAEEMTVRLASGRYFQAVVPTHDLLQASGAVVVLQSDAILRSNNLQMIKILSLVGLICLVLMVPLVVLYSRSIIRPILHLVERMKDIAEGEGDLRGRITVTARDEVGQLADSFNLFVDKIQTMVSEVKGNLGPLNDSSTGLSEIANSLARGAGQSLEKANIVAAAGEEMSSSMQSIAASMEQAATNISMVSENARKMSDNIREVITNTQRARTISVDAVQQATKASQQVGELGLAASEIEKVIETITEISEQVNLLALNATIEAARAGEAGKGFAVVANEIKVLANQTAGATDEIKRKVADIRQSTDGTVTEIEAITRVNNQINEIIQTISGKIEEQYSATSDIAENVAQASLGIGEVNENVAQSSVVSTEIARDIVEVKQTAERISQSSASVEERAAGLAGLSAQLKTIADRFLV